MKLPNFFHFEPLNTIKSMMGIPRDSHGDLTVMISPGRLTPRELDLLGSAEGLDVKFEELEVLFDGTLAYKGARVLLYIRDVSMYVRKNDERPKFHLSNCRTLHQMRGIQRFERYVIATKEDGYFNINWIESGRAVRRETVQLSVCQNCLVLLQFNGFRSDMNRDERQRRVSDFRLVHFFEKYPKSLHASQPRHNDLSAPLNVYTPEFDQISSNLRVHSNWTCEQCGVVLSKLENRRFLHVHHKNGQKSDNSRDNLEILCLFCHANEPVHHHMQSLPEYRVFEMIRRQLLRRP